MTTHTHIASLQINPLQAQLDMKGSSLAPKMLITVSADQPLQLTLTRSSVGRILSLVDVSSYRGHHLWGGWKVPLIDTRTAYLSSFPTDAYKDI